MRVAFVSDLHGNLCKIPECDLLIMAGDLTPTDIGPRNYKQKLDKHVAWVKGPFTDWVSDSPAKETVLIAGNHDFVFQERPDVVKGLPFTYLYNSSTEVGGVKIWGSPYTPWFYNWAFNAPRWYPKGQEFLKEIWNTIPNETDIVVTHGPPRGILDLTEWDREYVGCPALFKRIKEIKPKFHVFGHIHEEYGREVKKWEGTDKQTEFINASICTLQYDPTNLPIVVEI